MKKAIFALCIGNYSKGEQGNIGIMGTRRTRGTGEQEEQGKNKTKGTGEGGGQGNIAIRGTKGTGEQRNKGNKGT